jgi:hypothetical protein
MLIRAELDRWERRTGRRARLAGFSTHYNMSLSANERNGLSRPRLNRLARALTYMLPAPVMMLATNRRSTGVGARPRRNRIEVTADFTPDPALMIAAGSLIVGVIRDVMTWPDWTRNAIAREIPVIRAFKPTRHTSRHGWLAQFKCYPVNPFTCDVDAAVWSTTAGELSLRDISRHVFHRFKRSIAHISDPFSLRLIASMFEPGGATLLSLADRPPAYDDVGRLSVWDSDAWMDALPRSRYERVLMSAVAGKPLRLFGAPCTPVRVQGWSRVVFRREHDGTEMIVPVDLLVSRLDEWESA